MAFRFVTVNRFVERLNALSSLCFMNLGLFICSGIFLIGGSLIFDGSGSTDIFVCGRSRGLFVVRPRVSSMRCTYSDPGRSGMVAGRYSSSLLMFAPQSPDLMSSRFGS